MPAEFTFTVDGDEQINRQLSRFGDDVKDFSSFFRQVSERLQRASKELFDAQGRGWAPLSPAYAEWKAKHYPGKTILRRTDALYNSLAGRGRGHVEEIHPLQMRWGTEIPYARFHQRGTSKMPQRRVIDLVEREKVQIMKDLQYYVVKGFTRS